MNTKQIQKYVMRYLEATECQIIEKGRSYVTVKLSPEADKDLTGRSYYWSFVERTGAEPETMTFQFVFDPEGLKNETDAESASSSQPSTPPQDSILGRYFGHVSAQTVRRLPQDILTYGSRRLEQIFNVVRGKGKFVRLFEENRGTANRRPQAVGYTSWFGVNFKVEFTCDLKRDEYHSFGFNLCTGEFMEHFHEQMENVKLTPLLPTNIHLLPTRHTVAKAVSTMENHLEKKIKRYDHSWADEASERLQEELDRIKHYYEELLQTAEPEKKPEMEQEYRGRQQELEWQYKPRIVVSVMNCGLFHLKDGKAPLSDENR
nr:YqhG family protein [Aneurinibacillus sp. XH2]